MSIKCFISPHRPQRNTMYSKQNILRYKAVMPPDVDSYTSSACELYQTFVSQVCDITVARGEEEA
jgi:hypothetical protein